MPTYGAFDDFVTGLSAASALDGTEPIVVVQSGASVSATVREIQGGDGITNTVTITGEYLFTEDNELDYSSSITDAMSAATVTFSELPANTVSINVFIDTTDSGTSPLMTFKRSSGGTMIISIRAQFADAGNNALIGTWWLPTDGNSIYVNSVTGDGATTFNILGYKTGS